MNGLGCCWLNNKRCMCLEKFMLFSAQNYYQLISEVGWGAGEYSFLSAPRTGRKWYFPASWGLTGFAPHSGEKRLSEEGGQIHKVMFEPAVAFFLPLSLCSFTG